MSISRRFSGSPISARNSGWPVTRADRNAFAQRRGVRLTALRTVRSMKLTWVRRIGVIVWPMALGSSDCTAAISREIIAEEGQGSALDPLKAQP